MAKIHNSKKRMPLIFDSTQVNTWLSSDIQMGEIKSMIRPFEETKMKSHSISRKLNYFQKETTNIPEITDFVDYPQLQMLMS